MRLLPIALLLSAAALPGQDVVFNRDVRPILSDRCFQCHGPDSANRSTPLRLDTAEGAAVDLMSGGRAVVPGDPAASKLLERVTSDDPVRRMPPSYEGHAKLSDEEIDVLRRWIAQGAEWQGHWAFIPPERPEAPEVDLPGWGANPIDAFVLRRLRRAGLEPAAPASKEALIRRVSLDLTGLPPTPEEVDAFLADSSADAYGKVVDRLLASPRYGEHMAGPWLDAARYADTNGYQNDEERTMWRWRDWVIDAFNRNQPFDQFTIEQLAGDLLPDPTLDQLIATGFNRNHRGNGELGSDPTEFIVEYAVDRVETTSTVWLGLTFGCARCHDHKYDPLSQKEFYQLYAYFDQVPDRGRYFKYGNTPPFVHAPTEKQQARLDSLDAEIASAEGRLIHREDAVAQGLREWDGAGSEWALTERRVFDAFDEPESFDGERLEEFESEVNFDFFDPFTLAVRIRPETPTGGLISRYKPAANDRGNKGFGLFLQDGRVQLHLESTDIDDRMIARTAEPVPMNEWTQVTATYDGSRLTAGMAIYFDGEPVELETVIDHSNNNTIIKDVPLRFGIGPATDDRYRGQARGARIFDRALSPDQVAVLAVDKTPAEIAALKKRTRAQSDKFRLAWLAEAAPGDLRAAWKRVRSARLEREELLRKVPTVMVMAEREELRPTHLLNRGAFDAPTDQVFPALPATLHRGEAPTRLDLAQWLVSDTNPLTARVTVNRFWQMLFGTGIVKTTEDFGSQGEWPVHPELLDWLAVEFRESGWDVKGILKTIVTSAAYRQDSAATPEKIEKDPDNRLLSRGPRLRLSARAIRDQALAVSGLLHEQIGGPSVKPYQPPGLWTELSNWKAYEHGEGPELYRRSLYTFWKRTIAPPSMLAFDAAPRESCVVRDVRTNTPLQALDLMNDVAYLEAARMLAERMMRAADDPAGRLEHGFRLATARRPDGREAEILRASLRRFLDRYQGDREGAEAYLESGEHPRDVSLDVSEHAAYAAVASLILNLDEVVSKP